MQFTVSSSQLLKKLSSIKGVVVSNPVLPILENFLFRINGGKLTIIGTDLQTYYTGELEVEATEDAVLAIPAKMLIETLRNLPPQSLTFTIDESSFAIEIASSSGKYKLMGSSAYDYPKMPNLSPENEELGSQVIEKEIEGRVLSEVIAKVLFAVSMDEVKPAMLGVYIEGDSVDTRFVASNSSRLIRLIRKDLTMDTKVNILVPRKPLAMLANILSEAGAETTVKMKFSTSLVGFQVGDSLIVSRLIDEVYPNYKNVLPASSPNRMLIERDMLYSAMKRGAIYANKSDNVVHFNLTKNQLKLVASDGDFSNEAVEVMECTYEGQDLNITFNAKLFLDTLSHISSKEIEVLLGDEYRAALVLPYEERDEKEDYLILLMPFIVRDVVS